MPSSLTPNLNQTELSPNAMASTLSDTKGKPAGRQRIDVLDSLRAFASVSILLTHFVGAYGLSFPLFGFDASPWIIRFLHGSTSLSMFFVLSGFVLSAKYRMSDGMEGHQPFSLVSFYIQRISRILPTFIFILLISWACHPIYALKLETQPPQSEWAQSLWLDNYKPADIVKQAVFKSGATGNENLLPQDWTLRVTTKFILIIPFLIILATRSTAWLIAFTLIAIGVYKVELYLLHFTYGILISKYQAEIAAAFKRWPKRLPILGGVLLLSLYIGAHIVAGYSGTLKWFAAGGTAAGIVIGAIHVESWKRFLSLKALRFTGKISYSIYLWHMLVLIAFTPVIIAVLNNWGLSNLNGIRFIALLINFTITYILSIITFHLIEQPSNTLGKRLNSLYIRWASSWKRSTKDSLNPLL